jgi:hypothetical protein
MTALDTETTTVHVTGTEIATVSAEIEATTVPTPRDLGRSTGARMAGPCKTVFASLTAATKSSNYTACASEARQMPCRTSSRENRDRGPELNAHICDYRRPRCVDHMGLSKPRFGGAFLSAILSLGYCTASQECVWAMPHPGDRGRATGGRRGARTRTWISEYRITVARSRHIASCYQS